MDGRGAGGREDGGVRCGLCGVSPSSLPLKGRRPSCRRCSWQAAFGHRPLRASPPPQSCLLRGQPLPQGSPWSAEAPTVRVRARPVPPSVPFPHPFPTGVDPKGPSRKLGHTASRFRARFQEEPARSSPQPSASEGLSLQMGVPQSPG